MQTIEILFKDGKSITLRVQPGEAQKAIETFKSAGAGERKIEIKTLDSVDGAVFSTSEIRAIIPRWMGDKK